MNGHPHRSLLLFCLPERSGLNRQGYQQNVRYLLYVEAKLDCADLFGVTHWAMTRCYTLRASQLSHASATTSLRDIVNVNQPGYVVQHYKSAGVKVAWLFLFRLPS